MSCNNNCNNVCPNLMISTSVSIVTINGTDTLIINVPERYINNKETVCLVIAQAIPAAATRYMPVAISIGGNTTVVYPLVKCNCAPVIQSMIGAHKRYKMRLFMSGPTTGVFKVLTNLPCLEGNAGAGIPVPTTPTTGGNS